MLEGQPRLERLFGKNGRTMYVRACGLDDAPVEQSTPVKSVSNEVTFANDLTQRVDVEAAINSQAAKVGRRLRGKGLAGLTIGLRLRYADRSNRSVQRRLQNPTDDELSFAPLLCNMLDELWEPGMAVRLVGVSVGGFDGVAGEQGTLFDVADVAPSSSDAAPRVKDSKKRRGLLTATDLVKDRFGELGRCASVTNYATPATPPAPPAKNPADYK